MKYIESVKYTAVTAYPFVITPLLQAMRAYHFDSIEYSAIYISIMGTHQIGKHELPDRDNRAYVPYRYLLYVKVNRINSISRIGNACLPIQLACGVYPPCAYHGVGSDR